jgi:diguanylate cyclase (GGDEF)-like protein
LWQPTASGEQKSGQCDWKRTRSKTFLYPGRVMQTIVVDPSRTVLKIVGQLLESAGHRAHPFSDGKDALDFLQANSEIEALITSVELPTMSGIDLCRMARTLSSARRPLYIVVMSSNQDRALLLSALEAGADDFIGKPPATEELFVRMRAAERIGAMQRDLMRLATTDPLTGMLNRRAFFEQAEDICAQSNVTSKLSAIMFDIDHFKRVNDTYGHGAGDTVIGTIADEVRRGFRLAGRLGGEEFAVLLEGSAMPDAVKVAAQLRDSIGALNTDIDGETLKVACSFGVAEWEFGDTIDDLLRRADSALYDAKAAGRNRVVAFDHAKSGAGAIKRTGIVRVGER